MTPEDLAKMAELKRLATEASTTGWEQNKVLRKCLVDHLRPEDLEFVCAASNPTTILSLLRHIEELNGVVEKLPKTADGEPVVPGMGLWSEPYVEDGETYGPYQSVWVSGDVIWSGRKGSGSGPHYLGELYSTREAAEAAIAALRKEKHGCPACNGSKEHDHCCDEIKDAVRAVPGEMTDPKLIPSPAFCEYCQQRFDAPTTGKILDECLWCGRRMKSVPGGDGREEVGNGK